MQPVIISAVTAGSLFLLLLATLATPRKVNISANYWLSLFLFSFACVILDRPLIALDVYQQYPLLQGVMEITRLAMSPALYFSVLYFTIPERIFHKRDYLHFVPFALFVFYFALLATGLNKSAAFSWYSELPGDFRRGVAMTVFYAVKVQMIAYWILSFGQLMQHRSNIRLFASSLGPVSLSWLRYFLVGLAVGLFLSLNDVMMIVPNLVQFTDLGYLILTFYLAFFSLRQQEIFPYRTLDSTEIRELIKPETESGNVPRLTFEELAIRKKQIMTIMADERLFLNPSLGLPQLAAAVKLSTHDLSFVLNKGFHENFFQFVNRYRIEEAKMLLISPDHKHLNILGIANECGFNSKSTFNATFKKLTGKSPSEFARLEKIARTKVA
jgi:AraC-like DNA-binding protein